MPGNVQNAEPAEVFPLVLSTTMRRECYWEVEETVYPNGESQRQTLTDAPRHQWAFDGVLTRADMVTLRQFIEARKGTQEPFYFYDLTESGFVVDPLGVQVEGRYTVRFASGWMEVLKLGASALPGLRIIQLA